MSSRTRGGLFLPVRLPRSIQRIVNPGRPDAVLSTKANPPRGGGAKPGVSPRPPSCRKELHPSCWTAPPPRARRSHPFFWHLALGLPSSPLWPSRSSPLPLCPRRQRSGPGPRLPPRRPRPRGPLASGPGVPRSAAASGGPSAPASGAPARHVALLRAGRWPGRSGVARRGVRHAGEPPGARGVSDCSAGLAAAGLRVNGGPG